jgi:hypothetical protein
LSATYKLSPRRHPHLHQAATTINTCSLRKSGHPLSSWQRLAGGNVADANVELAGGLMRALFQDAF